MEAEQKRWEVYSSVLASTGIRLIYSKHATTASYDLERKIVFLPVWECLDDTATQALASHEIGHAKHSDFALDDFKEFTKRYGDLFNVVEDARIERLMKREFPGLGSIFKEGYKTLADNGIFPLNGIETASLVERLNVFAKFGFMVDVPFPSREEAEFSYRLTCLSTKTDVIDLCEDILDYLKARPKGKSSDSREWQNSGDDSSSDDEGESGEGESGVSSKKDFRNESANDGKGGAESGQDAGGSSLDGESESGADLRKELTDSRTRKMEREIHLRNRSLERENRCTDIIVIDSRKMIESSETVFDADILKTWKYSKHGGERRAMEKIAEKAAQSAASIFNQKKSALENASRSKKTIGRIDAKRLAKYCVSDAIFKQMEKTAQGKNHGVVLLVDFSGSMTNINHDKLKCACLQAAILGRFCQLCEVPFSIYAFGIEIAPTDDCSRYLNDIMKIGGSDWFDVRFVIALAFAKSGVKGVFIESRQETFTLSSGLGTPTFEATMVARRDILKMRAAGVEKPVLIVVTDGAHNGTMTGDDGTGQGTRNLDGIPAKIVIDGKTFSFSEAKKGMSPERADSVGRWAYEMLLGHLKKETGTSVVYSAMGSTHFLKQDFNHWVYAETHSDINGIAYGCSSGGIEPYIFRRAYLHKERLNGDPRWEKYEEKPFIEAKFNGDRIFSQFLLMNTSELQWIANDAKKIQDKTETDSVLTWLKASNRMLEAYKSLACAFIRYFS